MGNPKRTSKGPDRDRQFADAVPRVRLAHGIAANRGIASRSMRTLTPVSRGGQLGLFDMNYSTPLATKDSSLL